MSDTELKVLRYVCGGRGRVGSWGGREGGELRREGGWGRGGEGGEKGEGGLGVREGGKEVGRVARKAERAGKW